MAKKQIYLTESQINYIKQALEKARKETNTNPTEAQKEAGNYKMGRVRIHGLDIAIENPKGSYRRGKDKNGKEWKCLMHNDYGYFSHTLGKDGDAVDVFIGNNLDSKSIFAIDQKIDGKFDETKVMLGFNTAEEAKKAYLSNYEKDWKGFWKITEVTIEDFKKWLYNGFRQRKPFSEYQEIKKKKLNESKNNNKLLMESSIEEYFYEYDCESILNQFVVDMRNGVTVQNWKPLINPAMYQKALQIFTKQGDLDGFPEKYIYQWIGILMRNTIQLDSNTELAGHSMGIDCDALDNSAIGGYIKEKLGFEVIDWDDNCTLSVSPQYIINDLLHTRGLSEAEKEYIDEYLKNNPLNEDAVHQIGPNKGQTAMFLSQPELDYYDNEYMVKTRNKDLQGIVDIYNNHNGGEQDSRVLISSEGNQAKIGENGNILLTMDVYRLLDMVGLYDWMQMPDGSDAWSDFGLRPLFEILSEYDDNKTPEETLVIINKALDVTHQRGDMPSIFIEGGSRTLSQITHSTYLTESYLLDWEKEQIEDNNVNGTIKLYHNTTNQNLNDIINDGELDTHQHHSEGHGHMLFFTVNQDAWGVQSKISIEVPVNDFEDMTFRFVNNDSVITENNIPINKYNFKIENVKGLEYDRIIEILTSNDERLKNYLLSDFFADIPNIAEWFFNKVDYNF